MTLIGPAWVKKKPQVINIPVASKHNHKNNEKN
jgi:hypothetical protein